MDFISILKALQDQWVSMVFIAFCFYFWFKRVNKKLFNEENVKEIKKINEVIEVKENQLSKNKILNIQLYLEKQINVFEKYKIDRASVWVNHNWTRKGNFHFNYYSLINELTLWNGLKTFVSNIVKPDKVPHYVFSDYETIYNEKWYIFLKDISTVSSTMKHIADDFWTKSVYWFGLKNLDWDIEWFVLFATVFNYLEEEPTELQQIAENIRIIFLWNT